MSAPLIGLTTYGRHEHTLTTVHYDELHYLPACYSDCVRRAGGLPVLLTPGESDPPALLDRLDAIVFTGGADIDPERYGGDPGHTSLGRGDGERDTSELDALRLVADRADLPALCICRGFQLLNVALGGSLVEHVPDLGRGDMHRADDGLWILHDVDIRPGSRLARAMDSTRVRTTSGHHQALRRIAGPLEVTATAADGLAEGVELRDHPWLVGVQWHPELTAATDASQQRLFDALVEQARGRHIP